MCLDITTLYSLQVRITQQDGYNFVNRAVPFDSLRSPVVNHQEARYDREAAKKP